MKVLVTGATGFVGTALCAKLAACGFEVVPAVRTPSGLPHEVVVGNLDATTDWRLGLAGCDAVVHLAARVHVMDDSAQNPLALFRATNTEATLNLTRQVVQAGVKRFVFISSIKVNGAGFPHPRPLSHGERGAYVETDAPAPKDAYAISKWEAEQSLADIALRTGLEVIVLRPPLVYGPGVGANFLRLMQIVERGWPLPLSAIHNQRSLLYLGNFTDAIRLCIEHPAAAGQTFLLDDGRAVSTPELIRAVAHAMNRPAHLWSMPVSLLRWAGWLTGSSAAVSRLTASLYVDSHAIRSRLGWVPPYSMEAGLAQTVAAFTQDRVSGGRTVKSGQ